MLVIRGAYISGFYGIFNQASMLRFSPPLMALSKESPCTEGISLYTGLRGLAFFSGIQTSWNKTIMAAVSFGLPYSGQWRFSSNGESQTKSK